MKRVGVVLGLLFMVACGGSATPEPAAPEPSPAPPPEKSEDQSTSKSVPVASDEPKTDDSTAKPPAGDQLQTVMQLVIEDPELDKYLHLTEPGRFPLKMAGKDLPSGIALTKAGQPVKIVAGEPAKKDAVLVITKIELEPSDATVGYRFDIEGVVGTAHVKKASYGWELQSSRIVEHYRNDGEKK